jgi:fucose 4-O-acetylase-like acetyltransferase
LKLILDDFLFMTQRTGWVDYAKGIGIILVVYAHLLSSGYHAGLEIGESFFLLSDSLVYSFHMPLFFFLAGLFAGQSYLKRGAKRFFFDKVRILAYPYLIWSFLQAAVELFFAAHSFRGADCSSLLAIPYLPWAQFWFLYALLAMYTAYAVLRILPERIFILALLLTAWVLFFKPINTEILAMHGFSTGFLFFVFGVQAKEYLQRNESFSLSAALTSISLLLFLCSGWYIFEWIIAPTRLTDGSHPWYFLYLSVVGITTCIGLAQLLAAKKWCGFIQIFGRFSLQIYLVHMLAGVAARILLLQVLGVSDPFLHMVIGVGVGLTAPVILYKITLKIHFPYLFEWKRAVNSADN